MISKKPYIILSVILGCLGLLFTVMTLKSSHSEYVVDKASIRFDETRLNLGILKQMETKTVEFKFTNSSTNKLCIYDVRPSCGCTSAEWTKKPINNGESGTISVVYDSKTVGRFEKSIDVYCNTETGIVHLEIFGEVISDSIF